MHQNNLLLSIIVPMYNAEKTISKCINSILEQDFQEFELILVDDGSTDKTLQICEEYASRDERIIVAPMGKNCGLIAARKCGVELGRATYIGFVDSDDWIEKNMYSSLMKIQKEYACDLISSGIFADYIDNNDTIERVDHFDEGLYTDLPQTIYGTMLYDDNYGTFGIFCNLVNKLFKREILLSVYENIDTRVFYGEDCLTLFSYIMKISKLYILKKSFYHYMIHENSMCTSADERLSTNTFYLYKGLERAFLQKQEYKYVLLRQLKRYVLSIELHTLDKLYNISTFSLGTYNYQYDNLENKKVVLYGAGDSSESLYNYLVRECRCSIVAWVDKYPKGKNMRVLHDILPVTSISEFEFDYIIIAVINEKVANNIKKELVEIYGVNEKMILWNRVEYSRIQEKIGI